MHTPYIASRLSYKAISILRVNPYLNIYRLALYNGVETIYLGDQPLALRGIGVNECKECINRER